MRVRSLNGEERELIPVNPCTVCGTSAAGGVCTTCAKHLVGAALSKTRPAPPLLQARSRPWVGTSRGAR